MILLVRHALAVSRGKWEASDDRRPLTPRGERQAAALVEALESFAVERIVSSPAKRCKDAVGLLAKDRGLPVKTSKLLREGRGDDALDLVLDTVGDVVFCTHGDVVGAVLQGLRELGWPVPARARFAKGSTWVLSRAEACRYIPPPA